ncbi:hypothetical protein L1049_000686 [Liquidambar formosana]|uniref:DUF7746 domain-containing protein n=1 Tax=Liquidambar formosana TaxID=63359 RepID=A0AAP0R7W7_LIQFO
MNKILMVVTAYKQRQNASNSQAFHLIITGFTSQLKGWWDHFLDDQYRHNIEHTTKVDNNNNPILDARGQPVSDNINTLIYTIVRHFLGDPLTIIERASEVLSHLRYLTLDDFRWYKYVFLSKVLLREDCQNDYWKERFIAGLPKLFSEKVKQKLREMQDSESENEDASPIKNCTSSTCCNKPPEKSLMPLTREERQLLDFADTITDPELK